MLCAEWKREFKVFLSKYWQNTGGLPALPDKMKTHAVSCTGCNAVYRAASLLVNGRVLHKSAPAGLYERVSARFGGERPVPKPTWYRYALLPLAAALLVGISVFITLTFFAPQNNLVLVHLVLKAENATSVSVVGDWNGWNPEADVLHYNDGNGTWEIELQLTPHKEYRYQFYIDGSRWIPDPHSELTVDDGFGGVNSVLDI